MSEVKLSVTIITLNEEEKLPKCLASVKDIANEIIVVDSGSTDKTTMIAKKYGANVYHREFDNFANQKNFAASKTEGKWIFSIDADEWIEKDLADEIMIAVKGDYEGFLIPRRNFLLGGEIKHSRWSPDKHIWLWKKGRGKWVGEVHEEVEVQGKVGELTSAKLHYHYESIMEFFSMINNYSEREAEQMIKQGAKFSYFKLFTTPLSSFFGRYIYKKGFLDGWRGFVLSYMMGVYRLSTWIKVWHMKSLLR